MEMALEGIIEKIKQEGVAEADKKAQEIVSQAQQKAKSIVAEAEAQRKKTIAGATAEADKLKKQAEEGARQAVRDVVLMLKQKITDLFDQVLKKEIGEQLSPAILQEVIVKLIEHFKEQGVLELEVVLSKGDQEKLAKAILQTLRAELRKGVTFKVAATVENGFRIGQKGQNYFYDFTAEALTEAMKVYLNPKLRTILDASDK